MFLFVPLHPTRQVLERETTCYEALSLELGEEMKSVVSVQDAKDLPFKMKK